MLECHRNPEDVPVLITALQDVEYKVRYHALTASAMIGHRSAEPAMAAPLEDAVEESAQQQKKTFKRSEINASSCASNAASCQT